jgi:hypothetical protein
MRCDPWFPVLCRLALCFGLAPVVMHQATETAPLDPQTNWGAVLLGCVLLAMGLWHLVAFLGSHVRVDQASGRLHLRRLSLGLERDGGAWSWALADIEAVVLMPQRRAPLAWPPMIELRLVGGRHVAVGTIATIAPGLEEHAQRLALLIGCGVETPVEAPG